jgi:hypothetical protein
MRRIFKVHTRAHTIRLTKAQVDEGFLGDLEGYMSMCTFTLIKPGTSVSEAVDSLEVTINELRLRGKHSQEACR